MQNMLTFLLLTVIFWFAGVATLKIIYAMVQPDGMLDVAFGWQKTLDKWYEKAAAGSKIHRWLHDALGGCPMCTSFWFAPIWFVVYMAFTKLTLNWFVDDVVNGLGAKIFVCITWYIVFWSAGAMLGLIALKFKKK